MHVLSFPYFIVTFPFAVFFRTFFLSPWTSSCSVYHRMFLFSYAITSITFPGLCLKYNFFYREGTKVKVVYSRCCVGYKRDGPYRGPISVAQRHGITDPTTRAYHSKPFISRLINKPNTLLNTYIHFDKTVL